MEVRTRFAPSPTGYIHVGALRTALFAYLIAKHNNGDFLLRIEDTDQKRFVEGSTELIFDTLKWLGLNWDNEDIIFQTSRKEIYLEWAKKLIDKGLAYADPYTPEEMQKFREEDQKNKKAFLYRNRRPENPPEWKLGMPLRLKQTNLKRQEWHDEVRGELSAGAEVLDDIVIIKADGLPTYNFAHIVDDHEMEITHIVRGQEFISSTPNFLSIYEALEIEPPKFVTVPSILGETGGKKLGKRDGAKSADDYRQDGILPEAMINFLSSLGWNDGTEDEIYSIENLIQKFDISRIQQSGARFDEQKLIWLNGQWIRQISLDDLEKRSEKFWGKEAFDPAISDECRIKVLALIQDRLKTLSDIPTLSSYFFKDPSIDTQMIFTDKKLKNYSENQIANFLQEVVKKLTATEKWDAETLQNALNELLEELGEKPIVLFSLVRLSISFAPFSPALNDSLALLGRDTTLARLNAVINAIEND